jgi:outer membrane protein assembly factor BamB
MAVLAVLASTLLGLAGGAAVGWGGLTVLASVPVNTGAQYAIRGDSLYVAQVTVTGNQVTAYRLGDGRVRWSTPVTVLASLVNFQWVDGVVLASMYAPGVTGDHTMALDEQTGRVLWRSEDVPESPPPAPGRVLLHHEYPVDGSPGPFAPPGRLGTEVAAVDARDGRVAWRYRMGPGCGHAVDQAPGAGSRMAVLCPADADPRAGELRAVDLATGRADPAVRLALPVARAPDPLAVLRVDAPPIGPVLSIVAGRILVGTARDDGADLTVYDEATLRPLWTRRMSDSDYGATPCAAALCLSDGFGLTVVDPGTGSVRWHTPERAYAEPPGPLSGRLLVEPLGGARAVLVDVGTGRPVLDLSGWRAVTAGPEAVSIFARWQPHPDGRAWFATVGGSPLAVRLIGFAPDVLRDQCRTDDRYLVCQTLTHALRVWRYRG